MMLGYFMIVLLKHLGSLLFYPEQQQLEFVFQNGKKTNLGGLVDEELGYVCRKQHS